MPEMVGVPDLLETLQTKSLLITGNSGAGKTNAMEGLARFRPNGFCINTVGAFGYGTHVSYSNIGHVFRGGFWNIDCAKASDPVGLVRACLALTHRMGLAGKLPRPFCIMFEEADRFGNATYNLPEIQRISHAGRNYGCTTVINLHRLATAPEEYFTNAGAVLYGFCPENSYREHERLKRLLGKDLYSTYKYELRQFHFLTIDSYCQVAFCEVSKDRKYLYINPHRKGCEDGRVAESS